MGLKISTYPPKTAIMFCRTCGHYSSWDFRSGELVCLKCLNGKSHNIVQKPLVVNKVHIKLIDSRKTF